MAVLVAIYTRVSREDAEEPQSTRRQEQACREFAGSKGWEIANVYEDVDVSAYARGVRRPAFDELLKVAAAGRVDGVLVWKTDRLVRRASDFEKFWDRCERAGVFFASATEPIDSTTAMGLAVIRILVNFANVESTSIGLRLSSRMQEKARKGVPLGQWRHFGFDQTGTVIITSEAELLRDASARILRGESTRSLALDWTSRRIVTPQGKTVWHQDRLAKLLRSPRLVGDNTFHGEVVASDCFPPILDRLTHARLVALLADRHTRQGGERYLLTGILRCGACDSVMRAGTLGGGKVPGAPSVPTYRCTTRGGRCTRPAVIGAEFVEVLVTETVLVRIEKRGRRTASGPPQMDASGGALAIAYKRYSASLAELNRDFYVHRHLSRQEWKAARNGIEQQLVAARRSCDPTWHVSMLCRDGAPASFRGMWDDLDSVHRRDIIGSELVSAVVHRRGYQRYLTAMVEPQWSDDAVPTQSGWPPLALQAVRRWTEPESLSATQAATMLGLSRAQVLVRVNRGLLQAEKPSKDYRLRREHVERFGAEVRDSLDVATVAKMLGVGPHSVIKWIKRGELSGRLVGRKYLVPAGALVAWEEDLSHLIRPSEAAKLLGVDLSWVYRQIKSGGIGSLSDGWRRTFVDRRAIDALIDGRTGSLPTGESVSLAVAARMLRCGKATLVKFVGKGALPEVRDPHGRYRFSAEALRRAEVLLKDVVPRGSRGKPDHPRRRAQHSA